MFIPPRLPTFHPKLCRLQNYFLLLLLTRKFKTLSFILHTYACLFQQYCTLPCESNNALSLVFLVTKRDEVTGECRKLHNEDLNDLCFSPNIVRVIKSRRTRWAGHVVRVGGEEKRIEGFGRET